MAIQVVCAEKNLRTAVWSPKKVYPEIGSNDDVEIIVKMTVPAAAAGMILGRGGLNIKAINEQSGAHIQMTGKETAMFTQERVLTLTGSLRQCLKAAELVLNRLTEDEELSQYQNRGTTYSSDMSSFLWGNIGGRGSMGRGGGRGRGREGRGMQHTMDGSGEAEVGLGLGPTTITVEVPDSLIGYLLGREGVTMREINSLSGAKVVISPRGEFSDGATKRIVTIIGSAPCAQTAHMFILQKLNLANYAGPRRGAPGKRQVQAGEAEV